MNDDVHAGNNKVWQHAPQFARFLCEQVSSEATNKKLKTLANATDEIRNKQLQNGERSFKSV